MGQKCVPTRSGYWVARHDKLNASRQHNEQHYPQDIFLVLQNTPEENLAFNQLNSPSTKAA